MQRALVVAKGDAILAADLPAELFSGRAAVASAPGVSSATAPVANIGAADPAALAKALFQWARKNSKMKVIPAVERELIIQALIETNGNQVQASKLLGITCATLRKRVDKFNITSELAIK